MGLQGRHKSMDKVLKRSVRWLEQQTGVTKVILCLSEACRHRYTPGTLRFKQDVEGGFTLNGYSGRGVTHIFVRVSPMTARDAIKQCILDRFPTRP